MPNGRWWAALVTFERGEAPQEILPAEAQGACGWMGAVASDDEAAHRLLVRDLEFLGIRVLEISDLQEIFEIGELENLDKHLAENFNLIEPSKKTVWGTDRKSTRLNYSH